MVVGADHLQPVWAEPCIKAVYLSSKVERGWLGVFIAQWSEHRQLKVGGPVLDFPGGSPDVFSSSKFNDVDGAMALYSIAW